MGLCASKKNTPRWRFMRQRLMIEDMLEQLMHCEWWTRRCRRKGEKGKKGISELIDMEVLPLIMKSMRCHLNNEVIIAAAMRTLAAVLVDERCAEIVRLDQGRELIIKAIDVNKMDEYVVQDGGAAAAALKATGTVLGKRQIAAGEEAESLAEIADAMTKHPLKEEVMMAGCLALERLFMGPLRSQEHLASVRPLLLPEILADIGKNHFLDENLMCKVFHVSACSRACTHAPYNHIARTHHMFISLQLPCRQARPCTRMHTTQPPLHTCTYNRTNDPYTCTLTHHTRT